MTQFNVLSELGGYYVQYECSGGCEGKLRVELVRCQIDVVDEARATISFRCTDCSGTQMLSVSGEHATKLIEYERFREERLCGKQVLTACPGCGDQKVHAGSLKVTDYSQSDFGTYSFICPRCKRRVVISVVNRVIDILYAARDLLVPSQERE